MTAHAFQLLDKHGTGFQFGGTPGLGCRDGLFTLKHSSTHDGTMILHHTWALLTLSKHMTQPTTTYCCPSLNAIAPPQNLAWQSKQKYTDNVCIQKIEKEVVEIPQSVGMRQGDNMAPVLFLFLMTAFAETLEIVWRGKKIPILSVMTASDDNLINKKICSHTPVMFTSKTLTA
jgi:hypothetical protein